MPRGLGKERDLVHEQECRGPAVGLVLPPDPTAFVVPARQLLELLSERALGGKIPGQLMEQVERGILRSIGISLD